MLFSILIPVYNVEKYLSDCIQSVLRQSFKDFEVILINDGSTDSSGNICTKLAQIDSRIQVVHQENQGLLMTRRNAINRAKGDYCLFLDSDDYWEDNLLYVVNENICKFKCDIVIYNFKRFNGKKVVENKRICNDSFIFDTNNKEEIFKILLSDSDINSLCIKAVKKTIIDETDYSVFKDIQYAEDLLQTIPLLINANKIVYVDKAMYNYRVNQNSITHTFDIKFYKDICIVYNLLYNCLCKLNYNSEENMSKLSIKYMRIILNYLLPLLGLKIEKSTIISTVEEIKNTQIYLYSKKHLRINDLSIKNKVELFMISKNHYSLLMWYGRFYYTLKKIKYVVLNKKDRRET